ncbi:MAG TPA: transcription-repair coupling factor [Phycisphaerae bacterium]|nr:transcription-repair coupling factor [Phycisphaerae bacterium]
MLEKALDNELLREAARRIAPGKTVKVGGVWGSSGPMVAAALGRLTGRTVLLAVAHLDDADEAADDVEVLTGAAAQLFPAWEVDLGTEHINDEVAGERVRVCCLLAEPPDRRDEPVGVIVAPIMSLLQPVPSPETLAAGRISLGKGVELDPGALAAWLVDSGYERVEQVDQQGEFARRGGIVDVFPPGVNQAVRVEFFGDTIESIRRFDLDTQRSTDELAGYDLAGVLAGQETDPAKTTTFLDYLPDDAILCMVEPAEVMELGRELYQRTREMAASSQAAALREPDEVFLGMSRFAQVEMYTFAPDRRGDTTNLGIRSLERLSVNTHEALAELEQISRAADVWVYCENPAEQKRFREVLETSCPALSGRVTEAIGHLHRGFYWPDQRWAAVGHHEIFHRYAKVRRIRRVRAGRPIESMLDLQQGDCVVHLAHGIARFQGLQKLQREGRGEEYLTLRFADNALLHVPASQIQLVQKYVGVRGRRPNLSKLGGARWSRQKEKVSEAVQDMAADMLRIQALRQSSPGISYPRETDWWRGFCDEFVYTETEDQIASMQHVTDDMAAGRPMDRLLCGDVGYGKTELAMRAAFKVAEAGKQTAVLVPTTVLAGQHYRTFRERMADYPFEVDVLSRFRRPAEQGDIVKRLALGQIDVLIGTHRLLSDDVRFADLGLVVIDEEQRFGVEHKERLKRMRATVDVLTMTATPIPRTLHMALLGLRDISSLATPPLDRRSIHTEVCHYDDSLIRAVLLRELNRGGQVFFVHNRVFDIEPLAEHLRAQVPEGRIAVAHGQMPGGELEKTMLRFVRQEIDVLVCTTIIESGLDIPTANTMVIHDADRFGLAELHQLRGRVGRSQRKAYCYLLLPEGRPVNPAAAKRLKAIEEFSDLGAGFQIAMRDLEIRGAGNILGREQSGHIAVVGYELYCRILEQTVRALRGEPPLPRVDVHLELGLDSYLPRTYIPSDRQRMEVYRRIAACTGAPEVEQLGADLADAYGRIPPEVQTLLDLTEIRVRAAAAGIRSVIRIDPDIVFQVEDFSAAKGVFDGAAGSVRLPDDQTVHWRPPRAYLEAPTLVTVLLKRLRDAPRSA